MIQIKKDGSVIIEAKSPETGTEKQQSFAQNCKAEFFAEVSRWPENIKDKYSNFIDKMKDNVDSVFWIENRGKTAKNMLKESLA